MYAVEFTETFRQSLLSIDRGDREMVLRKAKSLSQSPESQGRPLVDQLKGLYRVRAGRYRILYKIYHRGSRVVCVLTGIRKEGDKADIYRLAVKLAKRGEL